MFVKIPVIEVWFVPAAPPVNPVPVGTNQLYVVPVGTIVVGAASTGVTVNEAPLQIADV